MNAPLGSAAQDQKRWYRFSVRELLLLMLAVAAFFGWGGLLYEQYRRFQPSEFYLNHADWQDEIRAVLDEVEPGGSTPIAFTATHGYGPAAVHDTKVYRFALPDAKRKAFMQALEGRLRQRLPAAGGRLRGGASSSSTAGQSSIHVYRVGSRAGTINLSLSPAAPDEVCLVIAMQEQRARRGNISAGAAAGS